MKNVNKTKWTKQRVSNIKKLLKGGRDVGARKLLDRYPDHKFYVVGTKLMIEFPNGVKK